MDTIGSSRKRNHPSGTLTRSRSQLFLHRNRSGQLRFDPVPTQSEPYTELVGFRGTSTNCKKAKPDDDELPRLLTKDLRARRVYSPPQSSGYDDSDCTGRKITDLSAENGDPRTDATETPDLGLSCEARSFDRGNTDSSDESSKLQDRKGKDGGDYSEKIDGLDGAPVRTTLPDAEICGGSTVNEDEGKQEVEVPVKDSTRNDSALKSKSVLRPRFQGKLFKAPGSVNYRRLFPFLMDTVGDDSGTPQLDFCRKDEEDGQEFRLPLSSQSHEASKAELKTDGCTMLGTNGSELTSSHYSRELQMQLDMKEVTVPAVEDNCLSESKADSTADYGVKDVGSDFPNDDFKQLSSHTNNLDCAKASNHSACTSQESGVLNEECILTTPDADIYDNSKVNVDQLESISQDDRHLKPVDLTRSTQENAGEGFCLKADKGKVSLLKNKSVPRQYLHRKLFKTPGSVSYKRLLPFLMDLTKDDSGTSKFDHQTHHQEDEADMRAKRFQLPLSSQRKETSIDEHTTDSSPMHGTVESNTLENYVLVNPSNELSHGNQPKLTPSQDLSELPMQLDAKEMVQEGLSAPSVNEHTEKFVIGSKDECLSVLEFNPCSVMVDDVHSAKNVANVAHSDCFKEVQNEISRQQNNESPPKDQNMLYINGDVSDLLFEHHSSKEKGSTIDYDESKQFVKLEERESVSKCPPECQSLSQLDSNMLDAEENGTSSHAISRSDNSVVFNHVRVSNDIHRSPSEKIISEKSDMAGHGGDKAASLPKGIVSFSRMPSKDSDNKNASEIENGSESKITGVLKRCPRFKLLKQAGSLNYQRLLPFLLNTMQDTSCDSVNDHYPKLPKFMDQTSLLPISTSNLRLTPISDSNGCVRVEHCAGNSGTQQQQQTGLHACHLNSDSSSPKSQIPEFRSSHDSCKVIQLQDEQVVLNGRCKPERSTDPSISVHGIDLPITTLAPIIKEVITREEKATLALSKSSVLSEVTGNSSFLTSNEKPPETHECCQSLSQPKVVEQLGVPAVGFRKGILKRNPRGCRGLCTCLNCVSFRLHAERAYEFSRNQLLDAEEVAHDLMKELSHLRNMLERSADSVNNNPVFDGSQVNEACRKAFAAEELAKDRLNQMHDDLNIHCRITSLQPPRVTFAVHVEEKVIQPGG
ncbi:hypothetical protein E2542_SST17030 [Spatholobus suberectus]|nr:hypothetical protein E2542_SST17030 [Spatholobus suberectus]